MRMDCYDVYKVAKNKKIQEIPSGIMLCITSKCNLMCKHCYNNSGINIKDMDKEKWKYIISEITSYDFGKIAISGGEPLLEKELIFELLSKYKNNSRVNFEITTNGYFVDKIFLDTLYKFNNRVTFVISIDGHNAEVNSETRGEKIAWSKAIDAIDLIKNYNKFGVRVNHTVNKKNVKYIEDFLLLMIRIGVNCTLIGPVAPLGRAKVNENKYILEMGERIKLISKIRQLQEKYREKIEIQVGTPGGVYDAVNFLVTPIDWFVVKSNGDVLLNIRFPYVIGNIADDTLRDIWSKVIKIQTDDRLIYDVLNTYVNKNQ